jgi:DNA-binding CsgD family transcriptional regulator
MEARMTATIPRTSSERPELSDREVEVLIAWLASDSKREVTERLFLADSTVSTYIQRVRSKYDAVGRPARTKVRLLIRAVEDGFIRLDDL